MCPGWDWLRRELDGASGKVATGVIPLPVEQDAALAADRELHPFEFSGGPTALRDL